MPYSHLTQTENEMFFKEGVIVGLTLKDYQQSFLENNTLADMLTNKRRQKRFEELTKYGYYFTPMANDYPYRKYPDWTKIASHFYCEIYANEEFISFINNKIIK